MKQPNSTTIGLFILGGILTFVMAVLLFSSGIIFKHQHLFVLYFHESLNGLDIGAPVKLNGVQVGQVRSIFVQFDSLGKKVQIPVVVSLDKSYLRQKYSPLSKKIRQDSDNESDIDRHQQIFLPGLIGTLKPDSFVTGKVFIELKYEPQEESRDLQKDPLLGYQKIPTKPSDLQNFGEKLMSISENLSRIDYASIGKNVERILAQLANVDGEKISDNLVKTAETLRKFLSSDSTVMHHAGQFFQQMSRTMRAMQTFFEFLEQNPDALINGKYQGTKL